MLEYDNAKDAHTKLAGTMCLYDGRLAYIKNVVEAEVGKLVATCVKQDTQKVFPALLTDPKLNFMRFNLGYVNRPRSSPWMFRRPVRQYRQGLTGDQCGFKVIKHDPNDYYSVDFDGYTAQMLEIFIRRSKTRQGWSKPTKRCSVGRFIETSPFGLMTCITIS